MEEYIYYILFLFAWVFAHSLWLGKLAKQVKRLETEVASLRREGN